MEAQLVKNLPAVREIWVPSLGPEKSDTRERLSIHIPFIGTIKGWLYSLHCPIHPCSLYFITVKMEVARSCPTLCNLMDCSPPDSSVHGMFQATILEWVAISFSNKWSINFKNCQRLHFIPETYIILYTINYTSIKSK